MRRGRDRKAEVGDTVLYTGYTTKHLDHKCIVKEYQTYWGNKPFMRPSCYIVECECGKTLKLRSNHIEKYKEII